MMNPHILVRRFIDRPEDTRDIRVDRGGVVFEGVEFDTEGPKVQLLLQPGTGELAVARTLENHYLRGDVVVEVHLDAWSADLDSGLRFPGEVTMMMDGIRLHVDSRALFSVNPVFEETLFRFPPGQAPPYGEEDSRRGFENAHFHYEVSTKAVDFFDGRRDEIEVKPVAGGLYAVGKDEYFTYVIERADGVAVLDPSLYPARAAAIIAWVHDTFPGKPIRHAVVTHFHKDHSGALRSYVQEGAAVVVSERGRPFFEDYLSRPARIGFGIEAGELAPNFVEVPTGGSMELGDSLRPMIAHQVNVPHSNDTVILHLPNENVTLFADMYASWQGDSAAAIVDALKVLGYDDGRVGFSHGGGELIPAAAFDGGRGGGRPGATDSTRFGSRGRFGRRGGAWCGS